MCVTVLKRHQEFRQTTCYHLTVHFYTFLRKVYESYLSSCCKIKQQSLKQKANQFYYIVR